MYERARERARVFIPCVPYRFCALLNEKQRGSGTQAASAFFFVYHPFLFARLVTFIICRRNSFPYSYSFASRLVWKFCPATQEKTPIKRNAVREPEIGRSSKAGFAEPRASPIDGSQQLFHDFRSVSLPNDATVGQRIEIDDMEKYCVSSFLLLLLFSVPFWLLFSLNTIIFNQWVCMALICSMTNVRDDS